MRNLLSANLLRLRKSRLFSVLLPVIFLVSALLTYHMYLDALRMAERGYYEDATLCVVLFQTLPFLGIIFSAFLSLFLGTEYSDGTMRNRLIVGHGRAVVYWSSLLTAILCCLCFTAAWLLGGLLVGVPLLALPRDEIPVLTANLLAAVFSAVSLAAVCNLIGMLCARRSNGVVLSMLLFFALLLLGSNLYNSLCEPELTQEMILTADNRIMPGALMPNSYYIGGAMRVFYETLLNILPTGQAILAANCDIAHPALQTAASLLLTAAVSGVGARCYERKNLK